MALEEGMRVDQYVWEWASINTPPYIAGGPIPLWIGSMLRLLRIPEDISVAELHERLLPPVGMDADPGDVCPAVPEVECQMVTAEQSFDHWCFQRDAKSWKERYFWDWASLHRGLFGDDEISALLCRRFR